MRPKGIQVQLHGEKKSLTFTVYGMSLEELKSHLEYFCESLTEAKQRKSPELDIKIKIKEVLK